MCPESLFGPPDTPAAPGGADGSNGVDDLLADLVFPFVPLANAEGPQPVDPPLNYVIASNSFSPTPEEILQRVSEHLAGEDA